MDTSDEPLVATGAGITQNILGKKAAAIVDPFGQKIRKKAETAEEQEEERERVAAAGLAEEKRTVTASALPQLSEIERRNRRRRASVSTRGFEQPTLGRTGLLGGARV